MLWGGIINRQTMPLVRINGRQRGESCVQDIILNHVPFIEENPTTVLMHDYASSHRDCDTKDFLENANMITLS